MLRPLKLRMYSLKYYSPLYKDSVTLVYSTAEKLQGCVGPVLLIDCSVLLNHYWTQNLLFGCERCHKLLRYLVLLLVCLESVRDQSRETGGKVLKYFVSNTALSI